jgi:uncharacterized membrane protein (DUF2068 family)
MQFVAVLEAAKGVLVLAVGFGLLALAHEHAQMIGERVVRHFYLNPASRYPRIFLDAASGVAGSHPGLLLLGAAVYATVRFIEAYGLWHERLWAAWFAVASGAIYVPVELWELLRGVTPIKIGLLAANVGIVLFLGRTLWLQVAKPG